MRKLIKVLLYLTAALAARAADSGRDVVVVYNTKLPDSKRVADYYAQRRNVPAEQILGFELTTNESISRDEFRRALQEPLAKKLESKKLWHIGSEVLPATNGATARAVWQVKQSKFRYLVLCYGVPVHILEDPNYKDKVVMTNMTAEARRNEAAVDSELALLPDIENHPPLGGPLRNPFYTATNAAAFDPAHGILMVTRLDGPSADIACGLVDKAIEAETDGLWGRAYFDLRSITDPGYKLGDQWIGGAADVCTHLGFETIVDTNPATFSADFPMSQIAIYCGWYIENASGPFAQKAVEFMPGAFAYHLHSFSAANIRDPDSHWTGPLLARGATITMGSVAEPYLVGTPDVTIFCSRLIYNGFSFGEAAYSSQTTLSWQTTVIGDPLYRPFAKRPDLLQAELENKHSKLVEWSWLRLVNLNLVRGLAPGRMTDFLEQLPTTSKSPVLMEKLAELYDRQGKPNAAAESCEAALKLDPSPEQRIRLRLTLADLRLSMGERQEATDDYKKLLEESPDYPGRYTVEQKLKDLQQPLVKQ